MRPHPLLVPLAVAVALTLPTPIEAGDLPITLSLKGGGLSLSQREQLVDGRRSLRLVVTDGRGNGHGWRLRGRSRAPLSISSVSVHCLGTCTLPSTDTSYPVRLLAVPTTVLHARKGSGMGRMEIEIALLGSVPVSLTLSR